MNKLILITKKRLMIFFIGIFLLQIIFLLYVDYVMYKKYPDLKYLRETHLYFHMVFLIIYSTMTYWLYLSSKFIDKELKRIASVVGTTSYSEERTERLLGQFGVYLNDILAQTLLLSDKRRLKIGAQQVLLQVLEEMIESFLIIVNLSGLVVGYSVQARDRLGSALQEGVYLSGLITEFEIKRYVAYFSVHSDTTNLGEEYKCYPIYDEQGFLHYVFIMDNSYVIQQTMEHSLDSLAQKVLHKKSFLSKNMINISRSNS